MAGQNRQTFRHGIRRGNHIVANPFRIKNTGPRLGAATLGKVEVATLKATPEDIAKYREQMRRI